MKLDATELYFAHFGASSKVGEILGSAIDRLKAWDDIAAKAIRENKFDELAEALRVQGYAEIGSIKGDGALYKELSEVIVPRNAAGFVKYYRDKMN